jgi:hypothetical protein
MGPPVVSALAILFPTGLREYLEPGVPTSFTVRIESGSEDYLDGSGNLHYRYDNGDFLTSELEPIENGFFRATLPPADCDALPEFYISAYGDEGSLVTNPSDAPDSYYSSFVGILTEVIEDDFEFDLDWTVDGDASDGHWERSVPVGGGERGDPISDYDGSGQCYVTDNQAGDSDVDGGSTYLTSPVIDLSDVEHATISYALWYTNNFGDNPNSDLFSTYISDDNGETWILANVVGPACPNGWIEQSIDVTDFMFPTDQVRVRFEASDLNLGSVVEAGIDAFKVSKLYCEATPVADETDEDNLASEFALLGNYPNPFNNQAIIKYALPEPTDVTIEIYDLLGRRVRILVDGKKQAGYHQVSWNSEGHSSGVYFYSIQAGDFSKTDKMLLLK